jgi:hypothetical protein
MDIQELELAVLRIPDPHHTDTQSVASIIQLIGPLYTITNDDDISRITLGIRIAPEREQIYNIAFRYVSSFRAIQDSWSPIRHIFVPAIGISSTTALRAIEQFSLNAHWRKVTVLSQPHTTQHVLGRQL